MERVERVLTPRFLAALVVLSVVWGVVGTLGPVSMWIYPLYFQMGTMWHIGITNGPIMLSAILFLILALAPTFRLNMGQLAVLYAWVAMASLAASLEFPVNLVGAQFVARTQPFAIERGVSALWPTIWSPPAEFLEPIKTGGAAVPWVQWAGPIAFWLLFFISMFMFTASNAIIWRRRWVEIDRIAFPAARVALTLFESAQRTTQQEVEKELSLKRKIILAALAGSFIFNLPWVLYVPFRWLPSIYGWERDPWAFWMPGLLDGINIINKPYDLVGIARFNFLPLTIGFAYLLPPTLLASALFFYVIFCWILPQIAYAMGMYPVGFSGTGTFGRHRYMGGQPPFKYYAMIDVGAVVGYAIFWLILFARDYVREVWRSVVRGPTPEEKIREPLPYRTATLMFLASIILLIIIHLISGATIYSAIINIVFAWIFMFSLGRLRCESGFTYTHGDPAMGTYANLHQHELAEMTIPFTSDARNFVVSGPLAMWMYARPGISCFNIPMFSGMLDAYNIAYTGNIRCREIFIGSLIGAIVTSIVSLPLMIHVSYSIGWYKLPLPARMGVGEASSYVVNDLYPSFWNGRIVPPWWPELSIGIALSVFLMIMRLKFVWWPFSPISLILGASSMSLGGVAGYMSIALVLKWLTLKVKGVKFYEQYGIPAAVGVIAGTSLAMLLGMILVILTAY
ncbi:MAG: DUF6785 family protein [Candidatus Bathyarchaeia archaeon]